MTFDAQKLKKIFLEQKYIKPDALEKAEKEAAKRGQDFIEILYRENLITKDLLGQALAEYYGIPYADLNSLMPSVQEITKIPSDLGKKLRAVFFKETGTTITVATDDPTRAELVEELKSLFKKKKIIIAYSVSEDIDDALKLYRTFLGAKFLDLIEQASDAPHILEEMIEEGLAYRASDIHLEPQELDIVVRFRIDGVLQEIGVFNKAHYEHILNRIKVQAHLRTDEHFTPQDGSLRHKKDGKAVNIRISVIPTLDGEKVVMRILTEYVRGFTLSDLGLSETHQQVLIEASERPFGMILVVGPTGSGKTTTMYGLLKHTNSPDINITTIEDPVEYKIVGINHIQVNTATNLTFAKGLRSIVRQDPDIIFLGEIRDKDSAEIAVNAALTGHLVLSTFHANDAATAIPRLLDMGIERFLLASTLQLIIAQTLVRRLCEKCRASEPVTTVAMKKFVGSSTLYRGKGCDVCKQTGYKGRIALFEFLKNSPAMQELTLKNPSTKEVWELARKEGTLTMFEDGIQKVKQGLTTMDEVMRVATPPDRRAA